MQIRYLGFEQLQNSRVYQFDVRTEGGPTQISVTADVAVFRSHRVGIQEGPLLCGNKLTADLERGWEGEHELTADDMRAHVDAKALADSERAATRKPHRRRGPDPETQEKSPWGRFGMR